MNVLIKPC